MSETNPYRSSDQALNMKVLLGEAQQGDSTIPTREIARVGHYQNGPEENFDTYDPMQPLMTQAMRGRRSMKKQLHKRKEAPQKPYYGETSVSLCKHKRMIALWSAGDPRNRYGTWQLAIREYFDRDPNFETEHKQCANVRPRDKTSFLSERMVQDFAHAGSPRGNAKLVERELSVLLQMWHYNEFVPILIQEQKDREEEEIRATRRERAADEQKQLEALIAKIEADQQLTIMKKIETVAGGRKRKRYEEEEADKDVKIDKKLHMDLGANAVEFDYVMSRSTQQVTIANSVSYSSSPAVENARYTDFEPSLQAHSPIYKLDKRKRDEDENENEGSSDDQHKVKRNRIEADNASPIVQPANDDAPNITATPDSFEVIISTPILHESIETSSSRAVSDQDLGSTSHAHNSDRSASIDSNSSVASRQSLLSDDVQESIAKSPSPQSSSQLDNYLQSCQDTNTQGPHQETTKRVRFPSYIEEFEARPRLQSLPAPEFVKEEDDNEGEGEGEDEDNRYSEDFSLEKEKVLSVPYKYAAEDEIDYEDGDITE